jgi:hypothetical protein
LSSFLLAALLVVSGQTPPAPLVAAPDEDAPASHVEQAPTSEREGRWAEREAQAPKRYLIESLAGLAGVALGSWGSIALFTAQCAGAFGGSPSACAPGGLLALPGFMAMPFGIWLTGNPGGFWWAVLGSLPGWIVAEVTFYFVDRGTPGAFNPAVYLPFLIPIIPGVLLHDWSATRELRQEEEEARMSRFFIIPAGPRGSLGASVRFAF